MNNQPGEISQKLRLGVKAAKAGNKAEAQALLLEVVTADESQVSGWQWLSYVIDDLDEKETCYLNILHLDPQNLFAKQGLEWLKSKRQGEPEIVTDTGLAVSPFSNTNPDRFDNPALCIYCTALTAEDDAFCPACKKPLVIKSRTRKDRSVWLWRAFFLQIYTIFYTFVFGIAWYAVMATIKLVPSFLSYWPLYFGLPIHNSLTRSKVILSIMPVWAFWLIMGIVIYSAILMVLLIYRVPYANLLYLLNGGLVLTISIIGLFFTKTGYLRVGAIMGIMLSLVIMHIALNLWGDFSYKETRLRLKVDPTAKNASSLHLSAREYARQGMWGQAVIHLRRATAKTPANPGYRIDLATAYIKSGHFKLAEEELQAAEKLSPNNPEIGQLRQKLAQQQKIQAKSGK